MLRYESILDAKDNQRVVYFPTSKEKDNDSETISDKNSSSQGSIQSRREQKLDAKCAEIIEKLQA